MSLDHSDEPGFPAAPTRVVKTRDLPFRCSVCKTRGPDSLGGCWTCRWLPHVVRKVRR